MAQVRLARVIPSMHVHLCVASWLFLLISPVFYFVPPFSFQPFQMFTSEFNERSRSNPLCDFRLGTVATSDHETPLTAKKCVERYCELANKTTQQLHKVSTPCIDDHHFKEELKSVGELSKVSSQIVLKCLYLARIGRPDILWSVNKLARSITKWTKACDKRLNRLI